MTTPPSQPKKMGRPPKFRGPKVPYDVVDRLLVEGEFVLGPEGQEVRVWPTQRDVAHRYGVSTGLIGAFAKTQNTAARRAAFQSGKPLPPISLAAALQAPVEPPLGSEDEGEDHEEAKRRPGRPRKAEAPVISQEELDRVLVYGEIVQTADGAATTVFPTYRQLADRYGVAVSYISAYVKSHNVLRRREDAKTRLALRVEDKLIEKRAEAIAVGKDDVVRLIDEFLLKFEKALKEDRVRSDNPTDVNTFVRLKEFILGGADSRQELHAALSLESIQQRYARMLQNRRSDPSLTGMVMPLAVHAEVSSPALSNDPCSDRVFAERSLSPEGLSPPPPSEAVAEKQHNYGDFEPADEEEK